MYDQLREDTLYIMLYAAVTTTAMLTSCFLLFRRGNAIAPGVTPPARLRRWVAAFLAVFVVNHIWYMGPTFFFTSDEDIMMTDLIGGLIDSITFFPLAIIVLFTMLQDRRRPLWPVAVMVVPLVVGMVWSVASRSIVLLPVFIVYILLMSIGLIIYMVCALRQYGRWLRDNYADLERKEVWQSFVVLAIMLLVFGIYALTGRSLAYEYILQVVVVVLIGYLLWRGETLSDLCIPESQEIDPLATGDVTCGETQESAPMTVLFGLSKNIGPLLKQHCEEPRLYLQYDITISQLATLIGINRSYLSKHFASQGITYNAYINGLRIQHFVNLYRQSAANHLPVSAQQLAYQSGFRSYNTFSIAFKKVMGMTATEWMRLTES
jgi:AraC-like DNA-binding protein